jgi:hypothetical protein
MRKILAGGLVAIAMAASAASLGTARAEADPSNQCYGAIVFGIATTWPWAHDGQMDFPPPPGAIALWVELFGPDVGFRRFGSSSFSSAANALSANKRPANT